MLVLAFWMSLSTVSASVMKVWSLVQASGSAMGLAVQRLS